MIKFEHSEKEIADAMAFYNCERSIAIDILNSDKLRLLNK